MRVVRNVTSKEACAPIASGIWHERYDADGRFLGFQIGATLVREEVSAGQSPVMLNAAAMLLNAGQAFQGSQSRTAALTEEQRLNRPKLDNGRRPMPEDAIERVNAKIRAFESPASRVSAELGSEMGDRAVRVYPNAV